MNCTGWRRHSDCSAASLQQRQRALDVDPVGHLRRELAAGREQRGQMVDDIDLIFADDPRQFVDIEQIGLDVGGQMANVLGQRLQIHGQQTVGAVLGQAA